MATTLESGPRLGIQVRVFRGDMTDWPRIYREFCNMLGTVPYGGGTLREALYEPRPVAAMMESLGGAAVKTESDSSQTSGGGAELSVDTGAAEQKEDKDKQSLAARQRAWDVRNAMVFSRLSLCLDAERASLIRRFDHDGENGQMPDGVGAWRALREKYEKTGEAQIERLHKLFSDETMKGPTEDPAYYFCRIDEYINRLEAMGEPLSNYSITGRVKKVLADSGTHYFLLLTILKRQPSLSYEALRKEVCEHYDDNIAGLATNDKGAALYGAAGAGDGPRRCFICSSTGHLMKDCPSKPSGGGRGGGGHGGRGHGGRGRGGGRGGGHKKPQACWNCDKTGHKRHECPEKPKKQAANLADGGDGDVGQEQYVAFTATLGADMTAPVAGLGDNYYSIHDGSGRQLSLVDSRGTFTVLEHKHAGDVIGCDVAFNATEFDDDPGAAQFGLLGMMVDSGCTIHMVKPKYIRDLYDVREHRAEITVADGRKVMSTHMGRIKGEATTSDGRLTLIQLSNVLVVPGLSTNLLSVQRLTLAGGSVEFSPDKADILMGRIRMPCDRRGQLYSLTIHTNRARAGPRMLPSEGVSERASERAFAASTADLWHQRLGHRNMADVRRLGEQDVGIPTGLTIEGRCDICEVGKHSSQSFPSSAVRSATQPFEILHADLGTVEVPSMRENKYFGLVTCEKTRYRIALFLPRKNAFLERFREMVLDVKALTNGGKIKRLHTDNGGEFIGVECEAWLKAQGILHTTTGAHAPQQNGIAERGIGVVVDMARCMLLQSGLGKQLWDEAVNTTCYLLNRQPTSALGGNTPYYALHGKQAAMDHLRVFGCRVWTQVPHGKRKKLDGKGQRGIMVGYNRNNRRSYRVYYPETDRILESVHVTFDEGVFPANPQQSESSPVLKPTQRHGDATPKLVSFDFEPTIIPHAATDVPDGTDHGGPAEGGEVEEPSASSEPRDDQVLDRMGAVVMRTHRNLQRKRLARAGDGPVEVDTSVGADGQVEVDTSVGADQEAEPPVLGRGHRIKTQLLCTIPGCKERPIHHQAHHVANRPTSISLFEGMAMRASADMLDEPRNYKEAMASPEAEFWKQACEEELRGLIKRGTFTLVSLPPGAKAIGSTWTFKKKRNAAGEVVRYKARLCVQGFTQVWGVDYGDTHSPVVSWEIIRVVFALTALLDYELHLMDVEQAFLQSDLQERVLVRQAEGHVQTGSNDGAMVYLLHKSLYGLKQASRNWYKRINGYLIEYGLKPSDADPCLYTMVKDDGTVLLVLLYVDDLAIVGSGLEVVTKFKTAIAKEFEMKDLGELEYMLGVQIKRDRANRTLEMLQTGYFDQVLARFDMGGHRPISTPMDSAKGAPARVTAADGGSVHQHYMAAVGCIMYGALITRPDVAFVAQALGRHLQSSTDVHMTAAKDVLRYLKGTRDMGIKFSPAPDTHGAIVLKGYVDSDWASDVATRRSTSAYLFTIGGGCVSWRSKLQPTVALSSAEAEYVAAAAATQEAVFLRRALADLGHVQPDPTILYEDNQGAIAMSENPVHRQRSKHIDVKHNFVREKVGSLEIKLVYVPTQDQLADMLTKPLAKIQLMRLRGRVMGYEK